MTSAAITKSEFAEDQGVGLSTVSNWIARGILFGPALTEDGMIVVEVAERQLAENLDVSRSLGKMSGLRGPPAAAPDQPVAPPAAGQPSHIERMQQLRVEGMERQARLDREADLERRGVYVRADTMRAEQNRAIAQLVAAIGNWMPDVAAELGLDRDGLTRLRASWRRFREHQARDASDRAADLPEHLTDAA